MHIHRTSEAMTCDLMNSLEYFGRQQSVCGPFHIKGYTLD